MMSSRRVSATCAESDLRSTPSDLAICVSYRDLPQGVRPLSLAAQLLLGALVALALFYIVRWFTLERRRARGGEQAGETAALRVLDPVVGFVTNFFDTLGIGSFAPTTSVFKLAKLVPDERIPGTLNAGHALPTVVQALIFIAAVSVDPLTLITMIAAAVLGAFLGAGVVAKLPRRAIQLGMGV